MASSSRYSSTLASGDRKESEMSTESPDAVVSAAGNGKTLVWRNVSVKLGLLGRGKVLLKQVSGR